MQIWVDADACPVEVKEILFRAADRTHVQVTLIANQLIRTPGSKYIRSVQVPKGFDVADNEIVKRCEAGDLVITADVPLADEVIAKGCTTLSPRGELDTASTIKAKLTMRNFMETLRNSGVETGGPASFSAADKQAFGRQLDTWLQKNRPSL